MYLVFGDVISDISDMSSFILLKYQDTNHMNFTS